MNVQWITIQTGEFEASKAFYRDTLGMTPKKEFSPGPGTQIAFFAAENGFQVELIASSNTAANNSGLSIGITVEDYRGLLAKARAEGFLQAEPVVLGEMECFFLRDPNGVGIQVIKG